MRTFLIIAFCFLTNVFFSQTINWADLINKWDCVKVIEVNGKDSIDTKQFLPSSNSYSANLNYKEEFPESHMTTVGKYKIDKTSKKISFINLVSTATFKHGKNPQPDYVFNSGRQTLIVVKLNSQTLVMLQKGTPNTETPFDLVFLYKKSK